MAAATAVQGETVKIVVTHVPRKFLWLKLWESTVTIQAPDLIGKTIGVVKDEIQQRRGWSLVGVVLNGENLQPFKWHTTILKVGDELELVDP